jgi:hypothetical protein
VANEDSLERASGRGESRRKWTEPRPWGAFADIIEEGVNPGLRRAQEPTGELAW